MSAAPELALAALARAPERLEPEVSHVAANVCMQVAWRQHLRMGAYFRCIHQRWVLILNAPAPHTRMWIGSARKWKAKMAEKGVQPTFL